MCIRDRRYIVLPQAIKNILPALANEAITLLKETAIVGYAAQQDITYVAVSYTHLDVYKRQGRCRR